MFKGNEIGTLLAAWELRWHKESHGGVANPNAVMLASTVSSKLLGAMAKKEGFIFEDTLTGFKWMGTRALSKKKILFFLFYFFVNGHTFKHRIKFL